MITLEFDKFFLINIYTPNSKQQLERLDFRVKEWEPLFLAYITMLQKTAKNVIICGDLNVAHQEIDIHNPVSNENSAGFTQEERDQAWRRKDSADGGGGRD